MLFALNSSGKIFTGTNLSKKPQIMYLIFERDNMNLVGSTLKRFEVEDLGEIKFRYPIMDDAEGLRDYINSLIDERVDFVIDEKVDLGEEIEYISDHLAEIEKGNQVGIVVEVGDNIKGFGRATKQEYACSHVAELGIGLRKEVRGRGIGTRLMEALIQEAKERLGTEIMKLSVFDTNTKAIKLYKKLGFEEVGRLKAGAKHYGEYKDLIFMEKDLRENQS